MAGDLSPDPNPVDPALDFPHEVAKDAPVALAADEPPVLDPKHTDVETVPQGDKCVWESPAFQVGADKALGAMLLQIAAPTKQNKIVVSLERDTAKGRETVAGGGFMPADTKADLSPINGAALPMLSTSIDEYKSTLGWYWRVKSDVPITFDLLGNI